MSKVNIFKKKKQEQVKSIPDGRIRLFTYQITTTSDCLISVNNQWFEILQSCDKIEIKICGKYYEVENSDNINGTDIKDIVSFVYKTMEVIKLWKEYVKNAEDN